MSDNAMKYKGYIGTVEYSDEDGCFIGRINGINDIITFEGESVGELRADFENAVEHYLAVCRKMGKAPEKQCSGKLLLRIPAELHYRLTVLAEASGDSVNSLVVGAVEAACKKRSYGKRERGVAARSGKDWDVAANSKGTYTVVAPRQRSKAAAIKK